MHVVDPDYGTRERKKPPVRVEPGGTWARRSDDEASEPKSTTSSRPAPLTARATMGRLAEQQRKLLEQLMGAGALPFPLRRPLRPLHLPLPSHTRRPAPRTTLARMAGCLRALDPVHEADSLLPLPLRALPTLPLLRPPPSSPRRLRLSTRNRGARHRHARHLALRPQALPPVRRRHLPP